MMLKFILIFIAINFIVAATADSDTDTTTKVGINNHFQVAEHENFIGKTEGKLY